MVLHIFKKKTQSSENKENKTNVHEQTVKELQNLYDNYEKHLLTKVVKSMEDTIKELEKKSSNSNYEPFIKFKAMVNAIKQDIKDKKYVEASQKSFELIQAVNQSNKYIKTHLEKHDSSKNISRFEETCKMNNLLKTNADPAKKIAKFQSEYYKTYMVTKLMHGSLGEKTRVKRATTAILAKYGKAFTQLRQKEKALMQLRKKVMEPDSPEEPRKYKK